MGLFKIYELASGTKADFVKTFGDNDNLRQQADIFWRNLENTAPYLIAIGLVLSFFFARSYYTWYNNQPGRHYKPSHWFVGQLICFGTVCLGSFLMENLLLNLSLKGTMGIVINVSFFNALIAFILYLIISVIWCNIRKTNAYKYFKF